MIRITSASSQADLEQIIALQRRYNFTSLSADQQECEGFLFVEYSIRLLRQMADELPQAVARLDDQVVGYCLSLPLSLLSEMPLLAAMVDHASPYAYGGKPLSEYSLLVGGQVCVDRPFRGQGLLRRLYHHMACHAPEDYNLCITEIATRNKVSLRAHQQMGFEPVTTYPNEGESWTIVAWPVGQRERLCHTAE